MLATVRVTEPGLPGMDRMSIPILNNTSTSQRQQNFLMGIDNEQYQTNVHADV